MLQNCLVFRVAGFFVFCFVTDSEFKLFQCLFLSFSVAAFLDLFIYLFIFSFSVTLTTSAKWCEFFH